MRKQNSQQTLQVNTSFYTASSSLMSLFGSSIIKEKKHPKLIKYKISKEKNKLLVGKKLKFAYKKCSVKTGKINFITKRPSKPSFTITVLPVFIMITVDRLVLTKDDKRSNLIRSIPLADIQRIDQHYIGTKCFDVILNQIVGKTIQTGQLSLCADKTKDMNNWVQLILEFKKCSVKGIKKVDHNGQLLLDLDKINKFTYKMGKSKNLDLNKLFYNNNIRKNFKSKNIKKALTELVSVAKTGELASQNLQRIYKGRMMKHREFKKNMEQKEFNMKMALANKAFQEKEIESSYQNRRIAKKEMRMLRRTAKRIESMKQKELSEYSSIYENEISQQKEESARQARNLMTMVNEQDKLTDFRLCHQKGLKHFKGTDIVNELCQQYYGKFVKS